MTFCFFPISGSGVFRTGSAAFTENEAGREGFADFLLPGRGEDGNDFGIDLRNRMGNRTQGRDLYPADQIVVESDHRDFPGDCDIPFHREVEESGGYPVGVEEDGIRVSRQNRGALRVVVAEFRRTSQKHPPCTLRCSDFIECALDPFFPGFVADAVENAPASVRIRCLIASQTPLPRSISSEW